MLQNLWQGTTGGELWAVRTYSEEAAGWGLLYERHVYVNVYERHVGEDWSRPRTAASPLCVAASRSVAASSRRSGQSNPVSAFALSSSALHCTADTVEPLFPLSLCASQPANAAADALNAETLLLPSPLNGSLNRFVTLVMCQPLKRQGCACPHFIMSLQLYYCPSTLLCPFNFIKSLQLYYCPSTLLCPFNFMLLIFLLLWKSLIVSVFCGIQYFVEMIDCISIMHQLLSIGNFTESPAQRWLFRLHKHWNEHGYIKWLKS